MNKILNFLIIEDDKYFAQYVAEIIKNFGPYEVCNDFKSAKSKITQNHYDIIVTDLNLGDQPDGLQVLKEVLKKSDSHALMVSSSDDEAMIEKAYALGAHHFLNKKHLKDHLPDYIRNLLIIESSHQLKDLIENEYLTSDNKLISEITALCQVNWKNKSLYISGPTGTGKSLFGKIIHKVCFPKSAPLIHLNCSELPENLLESELFGHKKGAFTGADSDKKGKLELAHDGILFLDEVGTMSTLMQQKLLKAIDEKTFYPLGSSTLVQSNFTLICATCEDLKEKISRNEFRKDLYYRLKGLELKLPALCERPHDIEVLVHHFQKKSARRFIIKKSALDFLKSYSWPGNIRELRKTIEYLSSLPKGIIEREIVENYLAIEEEEKTPKHGLIDQDVLDYIKTHGLRDYFTLIEKEAVKDSYLRHEGKVTSCLKELKISSSAFYRIINQLSF